MGLKFFLEAGFKFFKKYTRLPGSPAICGEIVEPDKGLTFWLETEDTREGALSGMVPGRDDLCGPKTSNASELVPPNRLAFQIPMFDSGHRTASGTSAQRHRNLSSTHECHG